MPTTTTEELFTRLRAVLDHGPVSSSSLHYALTTLDALAQRTRDLAGEKATLQRLYNDCEADRVKAYHARAGLAGERDRYRDALQHLRDMPPGRTRIYAKNIAFAALAPAEAGHSCNTSDLAKQDCPQCEAESPTPEPDEAGEGTACNLVCHVCKVSIGKGETIMWHGSGLGAAHVTCELGLAHDVPATPEPGEAGDGEILDWVATRWWLDIGTQNTKWREFDPSDSSETNDLRGDIIAAMRADDA